MNADNGALLILIGVCLICIGVLGVIFGWPGIFAGSMVAMFAVAAGTWWARN